MDADTDDEANNIGPIFQNLMSESFRVSSWFCCCSWNFFTEDVVFTAYSKFPFSYSTRFSFLLKNLKLSVIK